MVEVNAIQLAWQILEFGGAVLGILVAFISALKTIEWLQNQFAPKRYALASWTCAVIAFSLFLACAMLLSDAAEYLVIVPSVAIVLAALGLFVAWADEALRN